MKRRRSSDSIVWIANPFVVFTDCVIVLLLILILAVVHSSIASRDNVQRVAISQLQDQLLHELGSDPTNIRASPMLKSAFEKKQIVASFRDGDLQRFWFDGEFFFERGKANCTRSAEPVLQAFGRVLSAHQGDRNKRGNGLFKYLLVEGHADTGEGGKNAVQSLARLRAAEAERVLRHEDSPQGVSPMLIRSYGRADLDPTFVNFENGPLRRTLERMSPSQLAARNKRIEIVVVYSGDRAYNYLKRQSAPFPR